MPTDFPRGWLQSNQAAGAGTASLTLPATPNVAHVLDQLQLRLLNNTAAAIAVNVTITAGTFVITVTLYAAATSQDSLSLTGLDLTAGAGQALTIAFGSAAIANVWQTIIAQGHDI